MIFRRYALLLVFLLSCFSQAQAASLDAQSDNQTKLNGLQENCESCHHNSNFVERWLLKWADDTFDVNSCLENAETLDDELVCFNRQDETGRNITGLWRAYFSSVEIQKKIEEGKLGASPERAAYLDKQLKGLKREYMDRGSLSESDVRVLIDWLALDDTRAWLKTLAGMKNDATDHCTGTVISPDLMRHLTTDGQTLRGLWAKKNAEELGLKMFACQPAKPGLPYDAASQCFSDTERFPRYEHNQQDLLSPEARAANLTIKKLKDMDKRTAFWTRTSPDGRYVGNGMEGDQKGTDSRGKPVYDWHGVIDDLERQRTVRINALFDPGFSPDNKWLTFHGAQPSGKVAFCSMSMLGGNITAIDPEKDPRCVARTHDGHPLPIGQYQTMATSLDQPVQLTVQGRWENDNGASVTTYDSRTVDARARFGSNTLNIYGFNDEQPNLVVSKAIAGLVNEGDFMISPSGRIVASRFGGVGTRHLGYKLRLLSPSYIGGQLSDVSQSEVATICSHDADGHMLFGAGKPQFSFDERFIVAHSYNPRFTPTGTKQDHERIKESSADIYIYDLLTQKSLKLTNTTPGVYALYPHFRSDGWLYFLIRNRDGVLCGQQECPDAIVASDAAIHLAKMWH